MKLIILMFSLVLLSGCFQSRSEKKLVLKENCSKKLIESCSELGLMEYKDGNDLRSKFFFERSCEGGVMLDCHRVGVFEAHAENHERAYQYLNLACEKGEKEACGPAQASKNKISSSAVPQSSLERNTSSASNSSDDTWDMDCTKENLISRFNLKSLTQKESEFNINYYILSGFLKQEVSENFKTENNLTYYFDGEHTGNSANVYACDKKKLMMIRTELVNDYFNSANRAAKYSYFKKEIINKYGAVSWEKKILDSWTKKDSYYVENYGNNSQFSVVTLLTGSSFTQYRYHNSLKEKALEYINKIKDEENKKVEDELKSKLNRI